MKISLWPHSGRTSAEVLDVARWADSAGWHGIWFADHYMPNTGTTETTSGPVHECWALLPAVAAVTSTVRVGSLVAPTSVHHPAVLANRAVTIDHVSDGRMVLGIGAGWQVNEHRAFGIELEPPGARVSRFEEAIQVIRSLFDQDRTTFAGDVYTITDAPCDPPPVQDRLPILVGTRGPRMLRITASHADEWNTWGDPALAGERRAVFEQACEDVGRDPAGMWTSVQAMLYPEGVSGPIGRSVAGSDDQLVDALGTYAELGFDEFILPEWNLGDTPEERRDALERLHTDVLVQAS